MMWVLVWKEYREQRNIWLALATFGVLGLVIPTLVFAPDGFAGKPNLQDTLGVVALVLAWTHGMVCGAILLAGEREIGTLTFLDLLPGGRRQVWWSKLLAGLLLVSLQAGFLIGLGCWLGLANEHTPLPIGIFLILFLALVGFAWGVFCSALSRTVLSAIGLALIGQFLAGPVSAVFAALLLIPFAIVFRTPEPTQAWPVISLALVLFGPFVGSALVWSHPDQQRDLTTRISSRKEWRSGWRSAWWLAWKQEGWFPLVLLTFSLVGGLLVPFEGLFLWPVLTLALGVVCGATVFLDEQQTGSWRFLGDQRIPLARFWCVKVGQRLGLVVLATLVVFLPSFFMDLMDSSRWQPPRDHEPWLSRIFQTSTLDELVPNGLFLTMWVLYGFSIGHLCGLVFRKPLVALVASTGLSILLAGAWIPSLLGGGLHPGPVLAVPILLLVTARCLLRPWACDRLASGWPLAGLAGTILLVLLFLIGGIGYRILEVPDVAEPMPLATYLAGFPPPEKNQAGSLVRANCRRASELANQVNPARRDRQPVDLHGILSEVVHTGWSGKNPEADRMLDTIFADPWAKKLQEAAELPTGVVIDPRRMNFHSAEPMFNQAQTAVWLLAGRGLQLQARGDPAAFVDLCKAGLGVSRNLHHRGPLVAALLARSCQDILSIATERWLEGLAGHPELIRALLQLYLETGDEAFTEHSGEQWGGYLISLNSLDDPEHWVYRRQPAREGVNEVGLVAAAWLVPWEQERHLRLVRAQYWGDPEQRALANRLGMGMGLLPIRLDKRDDRRLAHWRAVKLMLALRLYQAEKGRPARSLEDLVPRYLERIPTDPFAGLPFRYRLSTGEKIIWPKREPFPPPGAPGGAIADGPELLPPPVEDLPPGGKPQPRLLERPDPAPGLVLPGPGGIPPVGMPVLPPGLLPPPTFKVIPAGQGILWSVGEDGNDDGGIRQFNPGMSGTTRGEDIIYLVPLPAGKAAR
jgi:hypothetical protein